MMWVPSRAGKRLAVLVLPAWLVAFICGVVADTARGFAVAAWLVIVAVTVTVASAVVAASAIFDLERDDQ